MIVEGSLRSLVFFDVAEAIRLDQLSTILGASAAGVAPASTRSPAEYVRFERPPAVENCPGGRISYYDYGVISVQQEVPFRGEWKQLVQHSGPRVSDPAVEREAEQLVRKRVKLAITAFTKPYDRWLTEDYFIVRINPGHLTAKQLLEEYGPDIAQLIRGETQPLSDEAVQDVLRSRLSYYPNDLLVVGWNAALVVDPPEAAAPTMQLLEYANTQLLEYRRYDDVLTRVLEEVYKELDEGTGFFARWRMAGRAARLNTIRLDVIELAERTDNAVKFLSDMYYARVYNLAASRVGVPDYRHLVEEKLRTAGELYQFMVDQFQQGRAFVLELMVVIILVIELVFVFRGK
jgi:hypothetical protein